MKTTSWFSSLLRGTLQTLKITPFLPGIVTLILPPNLMMTAMATEPQPAIDCCGGVAELENDPAMKPVVPHAKVPPGPTELFKSKDARVKAHGGRISLLNLDLTRPPKERELIQSGQLGSPLSPTRSADADAIAEPKGRKVQELDNQLFGEAMQKWNEHKYDEAVQVFRQHRGKFANSPWAGEAELHLGCQAQFSANWEDAKASFQWILANQPKDSEIWQKARLRRGVLHYTQAEMDEAAKDFADMIKNDTSWERRTYAEAMLRQVNYMKGQLASLKVCGLESLAFILEQAGEKEKAKQIVQKKAPNDLGFTLGQLANVALDNGMDAHPISANKTALQKLPTPFLAHYTDRHYVVVTAVAKDGTISAYDSRIRRVTQLTGEQFAKQWSGKGILFEKLPDGTNPASAQELAAEVGGCCGLPRYPDDLGNPCPMDCNGLPMWQVNPVNMNLVVQDVPIWHNSAVGPSFEVRITYNSQDSLNQLRPFGNKWVSNLSSYAMESPAQGGTGDVLIVMPNGLGLTFTPNGAGGYNSPVDNASTLVKTANYSFDLTLTDGTIYRYGPPTAQSVSSLINAIIDRHNNALTIQYDANGLIDTVTDPQGKVFDFSYDANGHVTRVDDPWGRFATFTYNAGGDLIGQRDMGGLVYSYTYDANKYLTSVGKPSGTHLFYVEPSQDGTSNGTVKYPAPGAPMWSNYRITITDPMGYKEEFYFDGYYREGWHRDKRQYTSTRNATDAPKTSYSFTQVGGSNGKGVISSVSYENGGYVSYGNFNAFRLPQSATNENNNTSNFTYNSKGQTLTAQDPRLNTTTFAYQPNGVDLSSVTDALNHLVLELTYFQNRDVQTMVQHVSATETRTTALTYNTAGQIETVTNARGDLFTLEYYPTNHATSPSRLKTVHRGTIAGASLGTLVYDAKGRVITSTNVDGYTLTYGYDDLDRLISTTYPDSTTEVIERACCTVKSTKDRLGRSTRYGHDPLNRLIWQRDSRGVVTQYRYDPNGNLTKLIDGNGSVTQWEYDGRNREVKKTYADQTTFTRQYSGGRLWRTTDARGVVFTRYYDAASNLTSLQTTTVPQGLANISTSFTYDNMNRPATMTDGIGTTTWVRDWLGEITGATTVKSGGAWTDTFSYGYDALGQQTSRTVNGSTSSMVLDDLGRTTSAVNGLGTFTFNYLSATSPLLDTVTVPNGPTVDLDYYGANGDLRLREIWNKTAGGTLHSKFNYTYDAAGQMLTWKREGLGGTEPTEFTLAHDPAGQLLGAVLKGTTTGTVQNSFGYAYDKGGNRTTEVVGTALTMDTHNALNQITARATGTALPIRGTTDEAVSSVTVNGAPAKIEGGTKFEGTANVTTGNNTVTVVATDNGQPPNVTTKQYQVTVGAGAATTPTYDSNGNTLTDGTRSYEWDAMNRLVAVVQGTNRTEFTYDGFSRRSTVVEKVSGSVVSSRRLVWDGLGIAEERETTGNVLNKRYHGAGVEVVSGANTGNYFYTRDHLGSIREMVDSAGAVRARYDYDPYGKRTKLAGDLNSDFGFTGHYTHLGTGLVLAPNRAYDPATARWLSRDPIGEMGGINLYGYVENGPDKFVDPLGNFTFLPAIIGGVVGAVVGGITGGIKGGFKGAFSGVVGGLVTGAALVLTNGNWAAAGAAGAAASSIVSQLLNGEKPASPEGAAKICSAAIIGMLTAGCGDRLGGSIGVEWVTGFTDGILGGALDAVWSTIKELGKAVDDRYKPFMQDIPVYPYTPSDT